MIDSTLAGGEVFDGSGGAAFRADAGIRDGRIACRRAAFPGRGAVMIDSTLAGGEVFDGSGGAAFRADAGIRDGRIACRRAAFPGRRPS